LLVHREKTSEGDSRVGASFLRAGRTGNTTISVFFVLPVLDYEITAPWY